MDILGTLLMLLAGAVLTYFALAWGWLNPNSGWGKFVSEYWPGDTPEFIKKKLKQREEKAAQVLEDATRPVDVEQVIQETRTGDFLEVLGKAFQYVAKMIWEELEWFDGNKDHKVHIAPDGTRLREFTAILLSGGQMLTEQPEGDGRAMNWFLYKDFTSQIPQGFEGFMKGSPPDNPGPAARFAMSDQKDPVEFRVLDRTWITRDIIWADVRVEGGKPFARNDGGQKARVVMLLSQNREDTAEWLLYCDLRSGKGNDTLWIGRKFDPEVEIDRV